VGWEGVAGFARLLPARFRNSQQAMLTFWAPAAILVEDSPEIVTPWFFEDYRERRAEIFGEEIIVAHHLRKVAGKFAFFGV
jgi:hypothetical protein